MKKNILIALLIGATTSVLLVSCSKDDETAPVITLSGASSLEISLNSGAWVDPGASANDDEDGSVTVTSDASSANPNTNQVGTYVITYTATDAAGNVGTETRTVRVKNDAEEFAGTYNVHDSVVSDANYDYPQVIVVDETVNNRVHFNRFGDYANNTGIYANRISNGTLEIPSQTAANIGTLDSTNTCSVATHSFSSTNCIVSTGGFLLVYSDAITSPSPCVGTATGYALYVKQ